MMYRNTKTVEDEERELEELEAQISGKEQAEAEAKEQEIAEHDANLSAEEKTFKKRYGDAYLQSVVGWFEEAERRLAAS